MPPPPLKWPGYVAWAVILVVAGFLIIAAAKPEIRGRASDGGGVADLQISVGAKQIIGVKSVGSLFQKPSTNPTTAASSSMDANVLPLLGKLDELAVTPSQKVQVAIVAGEVNGATEAINRIDAIEKNPLEPLPPQLQDDLASLRKVYSSGPVSLDAAQRQGLIDRHGYPGKLAVTFGADASDPLRSQLISEGRKVLYIYVSLVAGGLLGIGLGIVLFIISIIFFATGSLRPLYARQPEASTVYLEIFAVWLLSYVLLSLLLSLIAGAHVPLILNWIVGLSLPMALGWGIFRGLSWSDLRHSLGWHSGRGWYVEIPMGIVGYIAGLPIIAVGIAIMLVLVTFSTAKPSHPIMNEPITSSFAVFALFSVASIFAPIVEETVFRGALFHHLRRRWNWLISSTIVATIFAAIHPQGWAVVPALMSIAIVLAAIREWRGSLLGSIAAHALHNGMLITLLVLTK